MGMHKGARMVGMSRQERRALEDYLFSNWDRFVKDGTYRDDVAKEASKALGKEITKGHVQSFMRAFGKIGTLRRRPTEGAPADHLAKARATYAAIKNNNTLTVVLLAELTVGMADFFGYTDVPAELRTILAAAKAAKHPADNGKAEPPGKKLF